jgi:glycosyltransferase involved in cell wall biosynthesis
VVATAVGGIPEVISQGQEGRLAPVGDIVQLSQQVNGLLANDMLRHVMGQRGAAKIESHYHIMQRVSGIEKVYDEILQRRNHSSSLH